MRFESKRFAVWQENQIIYVSMCLFVVMQLLNVAEH